MIVIAKTTIAWKTVQLVRWSSRKAWVVQACQSARAPDSALDESGIGVVPPIEISRHPSLDPRPWRGLSRVSRRTHLTSLMSQRHFFTLCLSWCSVWASRHPLQTNTFRISKKSSTGRSLGTSGGFCSLWHIRDVELVEQGSGWKCEMSTCKVWQEQNFALSIYFINEGLQANSWSPQTLMPVSSQTPPTRSHDYRRSLLAETGSLTTFLPLPGFLSNFSPHSNLAKVLLTLFPGYPEKQSV